MTKVLILAYTFPPYASVAGLRPYSWYKYLNNYDVYPIVVTRQWQNKFGNDLDYVLRGYSDSVVKDISAKGTLIKSPFNPNLADRMLIKYGVDKFKLFRKIITAYYEFLQFVLPIGGRKEIYFAADEFLKHNEVDLIIATGDPFILFKYASALSKKYSVPWIADYRDSWIQDKTSNNKIFKIWCAFFEKKILRNVSKITTVSTFIQKQIEQNIKGKDFEILYNGFDPEVIEVTKNIKQSSNVLSIGFAGTIYDWHPIESFIRVCHKIVEENADFKLQLNMYGINRKKELKEMLAAKYKTLEKFVKFHLRMPNLELAKSMAERNVFLLFNDYSFLGTKIFDYLAIKRKIIFCYEDDSEAKKLKSENYCIDEIESESKSLQSDMLNATNSGIIIKDAEHLKKTILDLGNELKTNGFIKCDSINIGDYSRTKQAKRLAKIIKEVKKSSNYAVKISHS